MCGWPFLCKRARRVKAEKVENLEFLSGPSPLLMASLVAFSFHIRGRAATRDPSPFRVLSALPLSVYQRWELPLSSLSLSLSLSLLFVCLSVSLSVADCLSAPNSSLSHFSLLLLALCLSLEKERLSWLRSLSVSSLDKEGKEGRSSILSKERDSDSWLEKERKESPERERESEKWWEREKEPETRKKKKKRTVLKLLQGGRSPREEQQREE